MPALEKQMDETEASLCAVGDVDDAIRLMIQIESSAINEAFSGVVMAADSSFVRKLGAFQEPSRSTSGTSARKLPTWSLTGCRCAENCVPRCFGCHRNGSCRRT
jgi:hypothetical protein